MDNNSYLPLRVVMPRPEHLRRPEGGGGPPKVFGDVTSETRRALADSLGKVGEHFRESFRRFPNTPAVAKVILKADAIAKSHRPVEIFHDDSCPVIGVADLGVLLVSVTPQGLAEAKRLIEQRDTQKFVANLSSIATVKPYESSDVFANTSRRALEERIDAGLLKLRLFNHRDDEINAGILQHCLDVLKADDFEILRPVYYASGLRTFSIRVRDIQQFEDLVTYVGTQSLDVFPEFVSIDTEGRAVREATVSDLEPPGADNYPIVGVVDSGIENPSLVSPWILASSQYVPTSDRDTAHGTFVGGLIVNSRGLNHDDPRFPALPCKIVDIQAIPRKGAGGVTDDQLLEILEGSFKDFPDVRVWNLSLGTKRKLAPRQFSDFAVGLDELQRKYDRLVVLAAGNNRATMLRPWPPAGYTGDELCIPTDSVAALVVGSVAHHALSNSAAPPEMPSPFTRKGPGPMYLQKPDVAHYGGNCTVTGDSTQVGVLSLDTNGMIAERIGTSYAAPLVSQIAAYVDTELSLKPSQNLLRALIIHSAALKTKNFDAELVRYRGFGVPGLLRDILSCSSSRATLIFEPKLYAGMQYEIRNFPIPDCLLNSKGGLTGVITMTLVYDPPVDADNQAEYVRTNVDVSLGTYSPNKQGKLTQHIEIPKQPEDIGALYERDLIEHGFKWSPVKVYKRKLTLGAGAGKEWRLMLHSYHRAGYANVDPQSAALVVTIEDPEGLLPVYQDVVRAMNNIALASSPLQIRSQARLKP